MFGWIHHNRLSMIKNIFFLSLHFCSLPHKSPEDPWQVDEHQDAEEQVVQVAEDAEKSLWKNIILGLVFRNKNGYKTNRFEKNAFLRSMYS